MDAGHEEELRAKEDLLGKVAEERDTLEERLKTAETNLNDLQGKNNVRRPSSALVCFLYGYCLNLAGKYIESFGSRCA